jgi:hypothetical protein
LIGKLCATPRGGGAASGLIEYLVGYAISDKGATRAQVVNALEGVYAEAELRPDLGTGVSWSPVAGGGTRPSSILIRNCASFSTASLEIDADAARNVGVRTSAMHFVWSWNTRESGALTDEQVHGYVAQVLRKLNLGHHRSVAVVHRDTLVHERDHDGSVLRDEQGLPRVRDGNLHVHCAVGTVDPRLGMAYDRTGLHRRMAWAEREVELEHGLEHDRGLAVVQDAGRSTAHVRWADTHELAAWRAQRKEERLVRQERRSFEGYRRRDGTFERYVDATVMPRLQVALELATLRHRRPDWATLHAVAARYGCELDIDSDSRVLIRNVGLGELRVAHEQERRDLRKSLNELDGDGAQSDERLAELWSVQSKLEAAERERKHKAGEIAFLAPTLYRDLPAFQGVDESEHEIVRTIESSPAVVLAEVTAQSSTFTRENVDLWLASRISDPTEIERLGDLVMRDTAVRMLTADTVQPLMTTTEILQIEGRLEVDARALAAARSEINRDDITRAISHFEALESERRQELFSLSPEQRDAVFQLSNGSLVAIDGLPGVGKTTIQGVVRVLGELTGREVVGLTLSQAAAERLELEAGFRCVNTARARILEEGHLPVIPRGGIVVVDEAAMVDSRANGRILQLARERNSVVLEVGDLRQLQPIDFGASFRIVKEVSLESGTYGELRSIQRQRNEWHKEGVEKLADAIVERDGIQRFEKVREALGVFAAHDALTWADDRDGAIDLAISKAHAHQAAGLDTLTLASDKDSVRHLAEEDRQRRGLSGQGQRYATDGGLREFTVGDRLMFLKNSLGKHGLGVRNGDRGRVIDARPNRITVQLDGRASKSVAFSPKKYRSFDYATASTVHKSQGASVDAAVAVIDRSVSAELVFVAASRSRQMVEIIVPRTVFRDLDDLAAHVADRISLKMTTHTYEEVLERTGGPETIRVRNIEAQREAAPVRRLYEADIVEPLRAIQAANTARSREVYQQRNFEIGVSALSIEAKLDARREALRSMRKTLAIIYREIRPQAFGDWLKERETLRHQTTHSHRERQDHVHSQSRGHERGERSFRHAEQTATNVRAGIER